MPVELSCQRCGKTFSVRPARQQTAKYCSYSCSNKRLLGPYKKGIKRKKKCAKCGKVMDWYKEYRRVPITTFQRQRFCSKACADVGGKRLRGSQHPWFKTDARRKDRRGKQNSWRRQVLQRDEFTCQECGVSGLGDGVYLVAHHIVEFSKDKEKRWELANGLTLCVTCHGKIHGYEGYSEIDDDEIVVKATPSSISRRVEVKCSWCKESIYKAPSDLIHYPSKQLKEYHFCNKNVCMANFYSKKKKGMSRQGNSVVCDGKEFLSYANLAREYGLETRLVNDRIRNQGLTPEQAVGVEPRQSRPRSGRAVTIGRIEYSSLKLACMDRSMPYNNVQGRLQNGWTVRQAFEIDQPPERKMSGRKVTVDKVRYPSIRSACDAFNVSYYVVLRRIGLGWTVKRALKTPVRSLR
jgi:hypothetical protein